MTAAGETHDPDLKSWVESANDGKSDFPIQNLPLGVFRQGGKRAICVAIGQNALDLTRARNCPALEALSPAIRRALASQSLNAFMKLGPAAWSELRLRLSRALTTRARGWQANRSALKPFLVPIDQVAMEVPASIGDYTDFYASIFHARNVGCLFRPDNPLLPNYKYVPIGYHGRASSIVIGGTNITRPCGQVKPKDANIPLFQPTQSLDYELELACFIGPGNPLGSPIPMHEADAHIFGFSLLNDWSARDIQAWEYQPLGPFLGKSFATSISPWIITTEALAPFRVPAAEREKDDPAAPAYLSSKENNERGAFDIQLEIFLQSEPMRASGLPPMRTGKTNACDLYWTPAQFIAHHTSNGCNLRPGDLLATGTVSGPGAGQAGCLLELTQGGARAIELPNREIRKFLEDGDEVIFRAFCERPGFARIGFGECRGRISPAVCR